MFVKLRFRDKCKTAVRSVLGIEFENELITKGRLAELTHGRFVVLEHTSEFDPFCSHDGICEYNGQRAYFEVKSTFLKLGAYASDSSIDELMMNNTQYSYLKKLCDEGQNVIIVMYYYPDNTLLMIDFSTTTFTKTTSVIYNGKGEKTCYSFDHPAVLKRIDKVLTKEFRSEIRTLQWKNFNRHNSCTSDRCVARYRR